MMGWWKLTFIWLQAFSPVSIRWIYENRYPEAFEPKHRVWKVSRLESDHSLKELGYLHLLRLSSQKWIVGISRQNPQWPDLWVNALNDVSDSVLHIFWQFPIWWQTEGNRLPWHWQRWQKQIVIESHSSIGLVRLGGVFFEPLYWQRAEGGCEMEVQEVDDTSGWPRRWIWKINEISFQLVMDQSRPLPKRWNWPSRFASQLDSDWAMLKSCW